MTQPLCANLQQPLCNSSATCLAAVFTSLLFSFSGFFLQFFLVILFSLLSYSHQSLFSLFVFLLYCDFFFSFLFSLVLFVPSIYVLCSLVSEVLFLVIRLPKTHTQSLLLSISLWLDMVWC
ncbi:hypothetical protein AAZX31_07G123400 [Glycine max]